ncbi:MAG: conjugal transfer protein [Defluviitaleaceae bacterium]|nr:conjugal transfer protein [Defluviitaleaceae bacterium]
MAKNKKNKIPKPKPSKEEIKQKNEEKAKAKKLKKASEKEMKHYKKNNEEYQLKGETTRVLARIGFWVVLGFVFIRGLVVILSPTEITELERIIADFRTEHVNIQNDNELFSFAEQFARNFFTHNGDAMEFRDRMIDFAGGNFPFLDFNFSSGHSQVLFTNAYRMVERSISQRDVYVFVQTQHVTTQNIAGMSITETESIEHTVRVPIMQNGNHFIVEDLPVFVMDRPNRLNNYSFSRFYDSSIELSPASPQINTGIQNTLELFFQTFYEGEQLVLNHFLSSAADSQNFVGFGGDLRFDSINNLSTFQISNNRYLALVGIGIIGRNNTVYPQNFNIVLVYENEILLVESKEARTVNIILN